MTSEADRFEIGHVRCTVLLDADVPVPAGMLFADLEPAVLRARTGAEPDEELAGVVTALLLERAGDLVLIDTGLGPERGGSLHALLGALGVERAAISVVVVSHAHGDHVGGAITRDGEPAFPNARHVVHEDEVRFWLDPVWEGAERGPFRLPAHVAETARRVLPVLQGTGLLDVVDRETQVARCVRVLPAPGHTPGHLTVAVADGVDELLWAADAFVHPANVDDPEPASRMDTDRPLTVATRRRLLERAAQRRAILAATHHRVRGRIERDGDAYRLAT